MNTCANNKCMLFVITINDIVSIFYYDNRFLGTLFGELIKYSFY